MPKLIKQKICGKKADQVIIDEMRDLDPMPFGKHKGVSMQDVPCRYLHYLWEDGLCNDKGSPVANYIRRNMDALKMEDDDLIWSMGK